MITHDPDVLLAEVQLVIDDLKREAAWQEHQHRYNASDTAKKAAIIIQALRDKVALLQASQVPEATWEPVSSDGFADGAPVYDVWACSNCFTEQETDGKPPTARYCEHCGARMKDPEEDDQGGVDPA